ncbi:uncharacterized protein LOC134191462 isoform X2 [Corticium candelabrum]|uniref:uncharacterized protein LOC134191462 isoform X2 n=1 Tax=Corticium candelabrum TaxID=121492 RepID=UPI002E25E83F|nr:uncharacterized protein LOC134191462 isoform X2 [Corticium candelabrum]
MDAANPTWSWDELATKFLCPRLKDVCPHELMQHQLRVLHILYTVTMVHRQDNFLDWFYRTMDTYEAVLQSAKTQIPHPGPSDPHWPLTHEQTFVSVHFLPPVESPLNLRSGDCFFQAPVSSQIGSLSFKYVKGGRVVPTSIGPQSFSVAFTRNYLQQIISMLSLSHDLSECTFSLLLVGAKGQIERLPLLEFATPRLKGMLCAKVCELSAVGHEKTENGCEKYPTLEEVAAKQLDIVESQSSDTFHGQSSEDNHVVSSIEKQHCNLKKNSDETSMKILHCYENGVGNAKQDVQQLCLEREMARLRTDVNQLRHLMADSHSVSNIEMVADLSESDSVSTTLQSESKFMGWKRDNLVTQAQRCLPAKIKDISFGMRSVISSKLDTFHSRYKDWRLVADGLGFSNDDIRRFNQAYSGGSGQSSPTMLMLEACGNTACGRLVNILDDLDMIDVLEVICEFQQHKGMKTNHLRSSGDNVKGLERDQSCMSTLLNRTAHSPETCSVTCEFNPAFIAQSLQNGHDQLSGGLQEAVLSVSLSKHSVQISRKEREEYQQNEPLFSAIEDIPPERRDTSDPDIMHLYDDDARELWLKLPGSRLEKPWKDIYTGLCHKAGRISPTAEKALFYILCPDRHGDFGKRKDCGVMVRMEAFTRLVKWFGPLTGNKRGFIQNIEQLVSKSLGANKTSWFAGYMSHVDACARLENTACGTFLVRFSETYGDMGGFALDLMANGEIESFHIDALPAQGILRFPYGDHKDEDFESLVELVDQLKTIPISTECPITLVAACPGLPFSRETRGYRSRAK